jgi:hypothetical protein
MICKQMMMTLDNFPVGAQNYSFIKYEGLNEDNKDDLIGDQNQTFSKLSNLDHSTVTMFYDIIVSSLDLLSGKTFSMLLMTNLDFQCFKKNWDNHNLNKQSACLVQLLESQKYQDQLGSVSVSKAQIDDIFAQKIS